VLGNSVTFRMIGNLNENNNSQIKHDVNKDLSAVCNTGIKITREIMTRFLITVKFGLKIEWY